MRRRRCFAIEQRGPTVLVAPTLKDQLADLAACTGRPVAELVEEAFGAYLSRVLAAPHLASVSQPQSRKICAPLGRRRSGVQRATSRMSIQACERKMLADGTVRSVTLIDRAPYGVMVWAGRIRSTACNKAAEQIELADYVLAETVSFRSWPDAMRYFERREFASLMEDIDAVGHDLYV